MQISLESIEQRENNPYQLFLDHFKNKETKRKYTKSLERFLKLIPSKIYQDSDIKIPNSQFVGSLASCFVLLARKDATLAQNIIAAYIKEEKKLVEQNKLNPNTVPNHIKPIKILLDSNEIPLHWKSLTRMYPRISISKDRAYSREELQKMLEASPSITDKLIIQMFSSAGFRLEAWDYFTWNDVIFFKNIDDSFRGASLLVYRGNPESYWTFLTPEACKTLDLKEFVL